MSNSPQERDLFALLDNRYSVRGFTEQRIDSALLAEIFQQAQRAPSNCNSQPWKSYVISGERCRQFAGTLSAAVADGVPANPDYDAGLAFFEEYRQRQVDCAFALYGSMGIERSDKAGRGLALLRNYDFFGAPHVAFIAMPKSFGMVSALDMGIYLQTLILIMQSYGISSCIQGTLAYYPDLVRKELGLPEDNSMQILCGISFGYEDKSHVANNTRTVRAELGESVSFFE